MRIKPRSVRVRLTLWYTGVLASIILIFSFGIYFFVRASLLQQIDQRLDRQLLTLREVLPDEPEELPEIEEHGSVDLFQVARGARIVYQTAGWRRTGLIEAPESRKPQPYQSWTSADGHSYRLRTETIGLTDRHFLVTAAVDGTIAQQSLRSLSATLLICFPAALLLAVVGGHLLAGRFLKPVGSMAAKAEVITAERLSERLPVDNPNDEFGRLALVFNGTLSRLEESFEQLRRFTADASHELRTPLTALRSVGEVGLRNDLDTAAYREVIGSMLEEADRLARLVDSLLVITRGESGRTKVTLERVELSSIVSEVLEFLRVLGEEKAQVFHLDANNPIMVEVDRSILRLAVINLLDNAIKYTPHEGEIHIVVKRSSEFRAMIEFVDQGPGIGPEHQGKIFDRFYRVEKARSTDPGGTGLGLAITRWAVEANGGQLEVESVEGCGSTFRIVLPTAN